MADILGPIDILNILLGCSLCSKMYKKQFWESKDTFASINNMKTMEVTKEWLEAILKKESRDKSISKVINIKSSPVVPKGDNYGSDMTRIKAQVLLSSGKKTSKSLVVKELPLTDARRDSINETGLFLREILMYRDILPSALILMEEAGDTNEPLWGECIDYNPYDRIILEDLSEKGYKMVKRLEGLDLNHAKLAVKSLAKFHALSVVMREKGKVPMDIFGVSAFEKRPDEDGFWETMFKDFTSYAEKTWGSEWEPILSNLRQKFDGKIVSLFRKYMKRDDSKFSVLNHGDCWLNNMLFEYSEDQDKPISLRFIDFQMPYYQSPAQDLQYFFNTSMSIDVRNNHLDILVKDYQNALEKQMEKFNCKTASPSLEEIKNEMVRFSTYGLLVAVLILPFMMVEKAEKMPDLEQLSKDIVQKKSASLDWAFQSETFQKNVKTILKKAADQGTI